jgi:predicted house-cleaning noncanonical NTP pyrophosphatase (MazG superfamily)
MEATTTKTINLYSYDDASDDLKEKIIEKHHDINVDTDFWFEYHYDDAKTIGLEIEEFDIYHGTIGGKVLESMPLVINKIIENHGKDCDTHILAKEYQSKWNALVEKYSTDNPEMVDVDNSDVFDDLADDMEKEFSDSLLEEYLSLLVKDYEYQTSEKAVIETIIANEYTFNEEGEIDR